MTRLLIHFVDETLTDFRWTEFDEASDSAVFTWQQVDATELENVATQNPYPVIFIIPQQSVYLTQVELPEKANRQILSAIEFQIEDQLAQDIESQHFALGNSTDNPIAIAVVSRSIMDRCLALAQGHGLRLIQIVPELFLCPWQGEGIALTKVPDGYLLRHGDYRGIKCKPQALPAIMALLKHDIESDTIISYGLESETALDLEGYTIEQQNLDSVQSGLVAAPLINLQQRDYQLSKAWKSLAQKWRWVAIFLVALLIVGSFNKTVELRQLERELAVIKQQQLELLTPYLPRVTADSNLKKLLIARMQQVRDDQSNQGFLPLLLEFTRAREKFPEVQISRIGYQGKQLSFDISSSRLNDIEALLEAVLEQAIDARLDNMSIKPGESAARLILQGDENV